MYRLLSRIFPTTSSLPRNPERILLVLPCCIGDVIIATIALQALRKAFPSAEITWAVGTWSGKVIAHHPALNAILDTGDIALPVKHPVEFFRFVSKVRKGQYDLAVSLVRSPLMSLALWLSGIPNRAGIDSAGRGFGYNIRASIDPDEIRHEALIYLDVVKALGAEIEGIFPEIPVNVVDRETVRSLLPSHNIQKPYIVVNPAGGINPGMTFTTKRYPLDRLATLVNRLSKHFNAQIVLVGGADDSPLLDSLQHQLQMQTVSFAGALTFSQIGALANESLMYIGNDTGLTHLSAASGANTVMLMGPSDPKRYAPYSPNAIALWKAWNIHARGVVEGISISFDWSKDGITVEEAFSQIVDFMRRQSNRQQ